MLTDGNGLHLVVKPNGSKLWQLRYRFGGKQNMLGLGIYPVVSLAMAREKTRRRAPADRRRYSRQNRTGEKHVIPIQ